MNLTYIELHRQLMYNPWTGHFYWKVSNSRRVHVGDIAGTKSEGYIQIRLNGIDCPSHRLAWFYVYGYWPENQIDHKDQNGYHNWISNLREVSQICNSRNAKISKKNTSGVKGVYFAKARNKWISQICINKKVINLGSNKDFEEAVCLRLAVEQCIGWNDCDLNSPAYQYVKENIQ